MGCSFLGKRSLREINIGKEIADELGRYSISHHCRAPQFNIIRYKKKGIIFFLCIFVFLLNINKVNNLRNKEIYKFIRKFIKF